MNERPTPADLTAYEPAVHRRVWRADELVRLEEAGILAHNERVELIGGEIVTMSPKGARHEEFKTELVLHWADRRPSDIKFAVEPPLRLGPYDEPEPDIILFPASVRLHQVRGDTVLLVVEVSDSSRSYDLKVKAPLYARYGVREFWMIDAQSLVTTVHRQPSPEGYRDVSTVQPGETLTPLASPALAVSIATLGLAAE